MSFKILSDVNNEINKIEYKEDIKGWGEKDYWATPNEMLNNKEGDCEDYAISKYFKLKENGFSPDSMRIVHVTLEDGRSHMVLTYQDDKDTYVLDNMNKDIVSLKDRKDFKQVYSFNEDGLFIGDKRVSDSGRISKWSELLSLMDDEDMTDEYEDGGI